MTRVATSRRGSHADRNPDPGARQAKATALWVTHTTDDAFRANVVATAPSMLPSTMVGVLQDPVETIVALKPAAHRG